jgi:hypothetical protein
MSKYDNYLSTENVMDAKMALETFYTFNKNVLSFFRGIDTQMRDVLDAPSVSAKEVELIKQQITSNLPTLNRLKVSIGMLDLATLSDEYGKKLQQQITYIKEIMTVGETDINLNQFDGLMKQNEATFAKEQEENRRIAKEEKERIVREEAACKAKEEIRRKAKEEEEKESIVCFLGVNIDSEICKKFGFSFVCGGIYNVRKGNTRVECYLSDGIVTRFICSYNPRYNNEPPSSLVKFPYNISFCDKYEDMVSKLGAPNKENFSGNQKEYIWVNAGLLKKYNITVRVNGEAIVAIYFS